ncbi:MAG: hypothetical protein MI867_21980 [Pseudomonadales bacterium]|nr:hypothetical protein [Pseudomonadales bacterium]
MNRLIGPLLAVVLLVLVGVGIWFSASDKLAERNQLHVVGLSGSEKLPFFRDERVIAAFAKHGLNVEVHKAGSRQIATHPDLKTVDFAFPAGTPAATKIKKQFPKTHSYTPFYTPMALASWQPIAKTLVGAGLAEDKGDHYLLDMNKFVESFKNETRWVDLPNNSEYPSSKQIFVKTTDVRKSNSAAMYLSLLAYLINGNAVPTNEADVGKLFPTIQDAFLKQGFVESSSQVPFDDYLVMGMGHTPLLFIYEAQFIGAANPEMGGLPQQATLIYPQPVIFSKHVLIGLTEGGKKLGELLEIDDELKRLANEHGFRNDQRQYFSQHVQRLGLTLAPGFIDVIEAPSYEITENIITRIESAY